MTFQFRLETLLKLRKDDRDQRRAALVEAETAAQIVVDRIADVDQEAAQMQTQRQPGVGAVDVDRLLSAHRYQMLLAMQRQQLMQQQKLLDEAVQQRRNAVIEADRKVKMLEKLKEKLHDEHSRQELLREIKLFDEAAARTKAQTL